LDRGPQNADSPQSPVKRERFHLSFSVIPIAHEDYMKQNELSLAAEHGATDRELRQIDPTLEFGNILPFFLNGGTSRFTRDPGEVRPIDDSIASCLVESEASGEMVAIDVSLDVETENRITQGPSDSQPYLQPTEFWPSDSPEVSDIIDQAMGDMSEDSDRATAAALHRWVRRNIDYGSDIIGSRYGVEPVLKQRFGRCWDLSDVFITLARAAGLPARQIGGWLYGREGHIWSQVWLEDEGVWLDVDTTAENLGVDASYIPIWGTRDGEMMFIYTRIPEIDRL
jgi:transglutaminase-like putative cysteine protease